MSSAKTARLRPPAPQSDPSLKTLTNVIVIGTDTARQEHHQSNVIAIGTAHTMSTRAETGTAGASTRPRCCRRHCTPKVRQKLRTARQEHHQCKAVAIGTAHTMSTRAETGTSGASTRPRCRRGHCTPKCDRSCVRHDRSIIKARLSPSALHTGWRQELKLVRQVPERDHVVAVGIAHRMATRAETGTSGASTRPRCRRRHRTQGATGVVARHDWRITETIFLLSTLQSSWRPELKPRRWAHQRHHVVAIGTALRLPTGAVSPTARVPPRPTLSPSALYQGWPTELLFWRTAGVMYSFLTAKSQRGTLRHRNAQCGTLLAWSEGDGSLPHSHRARRLTQW